MKVGQLKSPSQVSSCPTSSSLMKRWPWIWKRQPRAGQVPWRGRRLLSRGTRDGEKVGRGLESASTGTAKAVVDWMKRRGAQSMVRISELSILRVLGSRV